VQLWYKNSSWASVYSHEYIISNRAICYDPFRDGCDKGEFDDLSNIYVVGVKLASGTQVVQIASAKFVPRCPQDKGE
jgi:hypothetical protein